MSTSRSVLITGGSAGIGLALAQRYAERGDRVMVTGRSADALRHAAQGNPRTRDRRQ
ncbi:MULTISPECIES: SDR family NAD(P)-dependent oxidoreductase [Gordonia]|uniref:SDR family NAD(P)-dependent oxidoreductase n=1 Tax=Gordonia TaxID=2053 RepID=UPI0022B23C03|nr:MULTISPECIES: SDR family NAD(P)-dependent oxidoreductase [Gordonia]